MAQPATRIRKRQPSLSIISEKSKTRIPMWEERYPEIEWDADFLRRFIAEYPWKIASTMPKDPHAYVVRGKGPREADFIKFMQHIRAFGYDAKWFRLTNRYLDFEGHKYWTMGFTYKVTIIINRAILTTPAQPPSAKPQMFFAKDSSVAPYVIP